MARQMELTHEMLIELLDFDPVTGVFTWKVARSNRVKPGSRAGVFHPASGGRYISIGDEKIRAHRLAFFYVNKRWPNTDVRPLDNDYDNCAISNLKEVSRLELQHGRPSQQNNTSGFLGVSFNKRGKWQSTLTWNYKQISLGANFDTAESASEVREEAVRRLKLEKDQAGFDRVMEELRVWKGQKTAWRFLNRDHYGHAWSSFDDFCADVTDVPIMRYSMVPLDARKPIGPGNFDWTFPPEANRRSPEGIVAHNKARTERQGDVMRDKELRKKYGITLAQFREMEEAQNGVCDICHNPESQEHHKTGEVRELSVDHCHETKKVRALLCSGCNMAIGGMQDDVDRFYKAIDYVRKHTAKAFVCDDPNRDWLHVATTGHPMVDLSFGA